MNSLDLFADALWRYYRSGHASVRTERDDGYSGAEDIAWYLTTYPKFPRFERQALRFARGHVLDLGCGAGRHSLYLQRRGLRVTAIDSHPRIVELARTRGVTDVRVANICRRLPFGNGEFDTAILFGNNLGICGTVPLLKRMLRELNRIISRRGRILATTRMPSTTNPIHRAYLTQNIARGRAIGQMRLRLIYNGKRGAWFDLLLLAPTDLLQIAADEGWKLAHVLTYDFEEGYAVVLEKGQ